MKYKKSAFTLAEALILLLITALIAASLVPVITTRHAKPATHGKWICTMDKNGRHVVKTIMDGKETDFKTVSGNECIFTPPADAKNFTIKAVGGGGGGGGGTAGNVEVIYDSAAAGESFATTVPKDGYYTVTAIGGGGGGGGMGCGNASDYIPEHKFKQYDCFAGTGSFYDLSTSGFNSSKNDHTWNVGAQGWTNTEWQGCNKTAPDGTVYQYGYVDRPYPEWNTKKNYQKLYQNIKEYTDKYKNDTSQYYDPEFKKDYLVNYESYKDRGLCFAESNWPLSKEVNGKKGLFYVDETSDSALKCWNFPGEGGHTGSSYSKSNVFLSAGQTIYAIAGREGKGVQTGTQKTVKLFDPEYDAIRNYSVYLGDDGEKGGDTILNIGSLSRTVSGGAGGYSRMLQRLTYKDIPVYECPIEKVWGGSFQNRYDCGGKSQTSCSATTGCVNKYRQEWDYCGGAGKCSEKTSSSSCYGYYYTVLEGTGTYDENGVEIKKEVSKYHSCYNVYKSVWDHCASGTHQGWIYNVNTSKCTKKIRETLDMNITACVNSNSQRPKKDNGKDYREADYPYLVNPIQTTVMETLLNLEKDEGDYGSGGYGAGELIKSYLRPYNGSQYDKVLRGYDGLPGHVRIAKVSYTGGAGGQAGSYVSTASKKLEKLRITIGKGGSPSLANSNTPGFAGDDTVIKNDSGVILYTLRGGLPGISNSTNVQYSSGHVKGGNGAPSPMLNLNNKARIIPYGGMVTGNSSYDGKTPATEKWKSSLTGLGALYSVINSASDFIGGHPFDMTYGAGGGGGAASKTTAGNGGAGAPGAVIIEW